MIPRRQRDKVSDHVYRFRVLATRHSLNLIYVWAGVMLMGLGLLHHRRKTGSKVQCKLSRERERERERKEEMMTAFAFCCHRHC